MILSDREIQAALERGAVRITPAPVLGQFSSTAVDLTLGSELRTQGTAIQLEIWNVGGLAIVLDPGIPICQLIFEEVHGTPEKGYAGRFAAQGPETPPETKAAPSPTVRKRRRR